MGRSEPPRYLSRSSDDRSRRRSAARARARRQRRVALSLLIVSLVGGALGGWIALGTGGSKTQLAATSGALTTRQVEAAGTTTVRGSIPNESLRTTKHSTTATATDKRITGLLAALRDKTITIDPGHNGGNYLHSTEINRLVNAGTLRKPCDTTGTETNSGYTEAAYTLDVALRLAALLRSAGAHVVLTRTTNSGWGPCITERAAIGNRAHADAGISIHADGGPASGRGFHVIYPPSIQGLTDDIAAASYRLALDIRSAYAAATGMPYATYIGHDGLDERSDLGGLDLSDVPKVFIETGNMRNPIDAALLESRAFHVRVALALERGLAAFLDAR
jgi:N-acetylmuramoyl-L-alanine amidase